MILATMTLNYSHLLLSYLSDSLTIVVALSLRGAIISDCRDEMERREVPSEVLLDFYTQKSR
jgi:hypothetical protein